MTSPLIKAGAVSLTALFLSGCFQEQAAKDYSKIPARAPAAFTAKWAKSKFTVHVHDIFRGKSKYAQCEITDRATGIYYGLAANTKEVFVDNVIVSCSATGSLKIADANSTSRSCHYGAGTDKLTACSL